MGSCAGAALVEHGDELALRRQGRDRLGAAGLGALDTLPVAEGAGLVRRELTGDQGRPGGVGERGERQLSVLSPALAQGGELVEGVGCLLYTSPSPRDRQKSRMPSSA